jgi:hypothetical protein
LGEDRLRNRERERERERERKDFLQLVKIRAEGNNMLLRELAPLYLHLSALVKFKYMYKDVKSM